MYAMAGAVAVASAAVFMARTGGSSRNDEASGAVGGVLDRANRARATMADCDLSRQRALRCAQHDCERAHDGGSTAGIDRYAQRSVLPGNIETPSHQCGQLAEIDEAPRAGLLPAIEPARDPADSLPRRLPVVQI